MKYIVLSIALSTVLLSHPLPTADIGHGGQALKNLITQVKTDCFKRDANIFFTFGSTVQPSQVEAYKQIAQDLTQHAEIIYAEKIDQQKLLVGKIIQDKPALLKSVTLGIFSAICIADLHRGIKNFKTFTQCWSEGNRPGPKWVAAQQQLHPNLDWTWWRHYPWTTYSVSYCYFSQHIAPITLIPALGLLCAWGTYRYFHFAINKSNIVRSQIAELIEIIEYIKIIQTQLDA